MIPLAISVFVSCFFWFGRWEAHLRWLSLFLTAIIIAGLPIVQKFKEEITIVTLAFMAFIVSVYVLYLVVIVVLYAIRNYNNTSIVTAQVFKKA